MTDVVFGTGICEDTCSESGESWANDGECDDQNGIPSCPPGSDCTDCGMTAAEDTLGRILYEMVLCWNRSINGSEPQGCARLTVPNQITAQGQTVFSIGGSGALEDTICSGGLLGGCNGVNRIFLRMPPTMITWKPV